MNQVSWLIYLSNICGNIGGLLVFVSIILSVVTGIYFTISIVQENDGLSKYGAAEDNVKVIKEARKTRRFVPLLCVIIVLCWLVAAFTPSQETVLAIAASQVGEQVLHSPTGDLATKALNAWLQHQITLQSAPPPK